MTVLLDVKHSLVAGLIALGCMGVMGCSSEDSVTDLDPAGPPKILQVFVLDTDHGDYTLTYGIHRDLNRCGFDKESCPEGFDCSTVADDDPQTTLFDHCVDSAGKQPRVEAATVVGASMRIISKELLRPSTLEQFVCECGSGCPAGKEYSLDPNNCANCGNDPATLTVDETGRCLDLNDDTLPDLTTLLPGIATIVCGAALTYTTGIGDGFYYPSGNQLPTSNVGYSGLGPAIVLNINGTNLPTDIDCTLTLSDIPKDKDGSGFVATDGPISFHTEPLALGAAPDPAPTSATATAGVVDVTKAMITLTYITDLKASTVTATSVKLQEKGGAAVTVTPAVMGGSKIVIPLPMGTLKANTKYEVIVTTGVQDAFGQPLPAEFKYEFWTKPA